MWLLFHHLSTGRNFSETGSNTGPTLPVSFPSVAHRSGYLGRKETLGIGENVEFTNLSSQPGHQTMVTLPCSDTGFPMDTTTQEHTGWEGRTAFIQLHINHVYKEEVGCSEGWVQVQCPE